MADEEVVVGQTMGIHRRRRRALQPILVEIICPILAVAAAALHVPLYKPHIRVYLHRPGRCAVGLRHRTPSREHRRPVTVDKPYAHLKARPVYDEAVIEASCRGVVTYRHKILRARHGRGHARSRGHLGIIYHGAAQTVREALHGLHHIATRHRIASVEPSAPAAACIPPEAVYLHELVGNVVDIEQRLAAVHHALKRGRTVQLIP